MPYAFVGGGAADITFSTVTTIGASARIALVTGWWRPTAFGGETLWSAGTAAIGAYDIGGGEVGMDTDNTTDGRWTTTGMGFVVGEWRFCAWLLSTLNTGPAATWRVWSGSVEQAPTAVTVTNTVSPVGNFTGSATFYIGNFGTASTEAFPGDIADVTIAVSSAGAGASTHPFGIAAYGTVTDAEAQHIYETMVLPLWLGDPSVLFNRSVSGNFSRYHWSGDVGGLVVGNTSDSATLGPIAPTINGATWSQNGAPRPSHMPDMLPLRRR